MTSGYLMKPYNQQMYLVLVLPANGAYEFDEGARVSYRSSRSIVALLVLLHHAPAQIQDPAVVETV